MSTEYLLEEVDSCRHTDKRRHVVEMRHKDKETYRPFSPNKGISSNCTTVIVRRKFYMKRRYHTWHNISRKGNCSWNFTFFSPVYWSFFFSVDVTCFFSIIYNSSVTLYSLTEQWHLVTVYLGYGHDIATYEHDLPFLEFFLSRFKGFMARRCCCKALCDKVFVKMGYANKVTLPLSFPSPFKNIWLRINGHISSSFIYPDGGYLCCTWLTIL